MPQLSGIQVAIETREMIQFSEGNKKNYMICLISGDSEENINQEIKKIIKIYEGMPQKNDI